MSGGEDLALWRADGSSMGRRWGPKALLMTRPLQSGERARFGDVVVYELGEGLIAHRVVGVRDVAGGAMYRTQGDAAWTPDGLEIPEVRVRGVVVGVVCGEKMRAFTRMESVLTGGWLRLKALIATRGSVRPG